MPRLAISRRALLLSAASATTAACSRHKALGFHGYCFVANQTSRSVTAVDLNRFRVRQQIPLDSAPGAVLAHPTSGKVFVLAPDSGTVFEIAANTLSLTRRVRAGNQAVGMQFAPDNHALWVLYRDPAMLVEVPLDSFRANRRIRLSAPPDDFDLSQDNRAAIVSRPGHSIVLASLANASIEKTLDAHSEPSLVRFRPDARQLLVGSRSQRNLTIFDVPTGRVIVGLPLPLEPRNFCFSFDLGQLFVSGDGMDAVVIVFPYATEVGETILAGHAPDAMAVTPSYLLVANPESDGVTVLDVESRKLVAVVQVGRGPRHILITPDREYALVLNHQSGDLAVIRVSSLAAASDGTKRRYRSAPLFTMIPVGEGPVSAAIVGLSNA